MKNLRSTALAAATPLASSFALLGLLAGCAATPPTHFHSLLAAPRAGTAAAAPAATAWELLPVTVPVQVDQPTWVVRLPDESMAVLENERWIAPLADEIRAALAEQLREGAAGLRAEPRWRIGVEIQRFESLPGRLARIDAEWTVAAPGGGAPRLRCRAVFEQPAVPGYAALAAAHRAGVARLGGAIAAGLRSLEGGSAGACA